jgi:hypothetical protein
MRAALRVFEQQDSLNADRHGTIVPAKELRHAR